MGVLIQLCLDVAKDFASMLLLRVPLWLTRWLSVLVYLLFESIFVLIHNVLAYYLEVFSVYMGKYILVVILTPVSFKLHMFCPFVYCFCQLVVAVLLFFLFLFLSSMVLYMLCA